MTTPKEITQDDEIFVVSHSLFTKFMLTTDVISQIVHVLKANDCVVSRNDLRVFSFALECVDHSLREFALDCRFHTKTTKEMESISSLRKTSETPQK